MAKLINLNRARKQQAREEKRDISTENAAKHGLSKAEKLLMATRNARAQQMLDQHQNEDEITE